MYRWAVCLLVVGCAHEAKPVAPSPSGEGPQLWMQVAGDGEPTVVFEASGGEDSTVWDRIEPEVRLRSGVRTVVYDQAGRGKSAPVPGPHRLDQDVAALDQALARFAIKGPLILVAHGDGGLVAERMAATHPRVVGVVRVDASAPDAAAVASAAPHEVVEATGQEMRAQLEVVAQAVARLLQRLHASP
ncbi:MAG TPA: alpha/beta hydrolase [Kofleriaceae bacterium]